MHPRACASWCGRRASRAWVGIGEKTDEEIAAATQDAEPVITLPARTWKRTRHDPTGLLDAAEESTQAACAWLEERGLPFEVVEHVVPKGLDAVEFLSRVGPDAFLLPRRADPHYVRITFRAVG